MCGNPSRKTAEGGKQAGSEDSIGKEKKESSNRQVISRQTSFPDHPNADIVCVIIHSAVAFATLIKRLRKGPEKTNIESHPCPPSNRMNCRERSSFAPAREIPPYTRQGNN